MLMGKPRKLQMKQSAVNTILVPIDEFAKKKICEGHLYLKTKDGSSFCLMKPGIFIDPAFIEKHKIRKSIFNLEPVTNGDVKNQFVTILNEYKNLEFEKELKQKAVEIIRLFEKHYSHQQHFLNYAIACFDVFCDVPDDLLEKLNETDVHLFQKALYSASLAILIGLSNEFFNPVLLKDLFNLTMSLDLGLCDNDYSFYVSQACDEENKIPGSGRRWLLDHNASQLEMNVFLGHPERSYHLIKEQAGFLVHSELSEIILYQHELKDGTGFPRGIPKGLISSWESVVILADAMVEIHEHRELEEDALNFVYNFKNHKLNLLPVEKVFNKLCLSLRYGKESQEVAS
jgi:hypothetical protein